VIIILNLGAQVERKNIHLLIEAISKLPHEYKLLLVGPSDSDYNIRLETQITELGVRDKVIRAAYTPYPQAPIAYQMSDLFVLPSSFEGLPKVVFEALSCGVPVLGSGFKVGDDIDGLNYLKDLEVDTIHSQIKTIVEQHQHVDRGRIVVHHSWDSKAHELEEVYWKIINAPKV